MLVVCLCVSVVRVVVSPVSVPVPVSGGLSSTRCLLYLDIHTRRGDIIWLPSRVSWLLPRLFKFLSTLTFGAKHRVHIVSTTCDTVEKKKKKQGRLVLHVR